MRDWLITWGSWGLAPFGLLGMYVVGLKKTWGWVLSMTTQALWACYAIGTGQYGFLIGTCSYFGVYLKNWLAWRRDVRKSSTLRDLSEGDRLEITGVESLGDAEKAIAWLYRLGARRTARVHAYLSAATGLTVWARNGDQV